HEGRHFRRFRLVRLWICLGRIGLLRFGFRRIYLGCVRGTSLRRRNLLRLRKGRGIFPVRRFFLLCSAALGRSGHAIVLAAPVERNYIRPLRSLLLHAGARWRPVRRTLARHVPVVVIWTFV